MPHFSNSERVVVVCATPPHFNPGMHSVDVSLDFVLKRHDIKVQLDRRVLYTPEELHRKGFGGSTNDYHSPFVYRSIRAVDAQLGRAQCILFWGDFLHSRGHRGDVASILSACKFARDQEDALRLVDRYLFLNDQPAAVLARSILFGHCLLTETDQAKPDDEYVRHLRRLLQGAHGVWMRDILSAQRAAELRGSHQSHLGLDSALLLRPEDCQEIAGVDQSLGGTRAGIFFGRIDQDPVSLLHFAKRLCRNLRAEPSWLPWLSATAVPLQVVRSAWPELSVSPSNETLPSVLASLLRCNFVITDMYHLCVHAWNNGIPAVCVGRGASHFTTSISDKKKELFFLTHGAGRFYVFAEHLKEMLEADGASQSANPSRPQDVIPPTFESLSSILHDRPLIASIQASIRGQREKVEPLFVQALEQLLGSDGGKCAPKTILKKMHSIQRRALEVLKQAKALLGLPKSK